MALKSQGILLKRGDGGNPETFTAIAEVVDFNGPDGRAREIDVTHLASTAREVIVGLKDEGSFAFNGNLVPSDAAQTGLRTDRDGQVLRNFELHLSDNPATVLSFAAYVQQFAISAGVDDTVTVAVTLRISGVVTWG